MTQPTSEWGRGSWMQTYTGRQFYPLSAHPDDIDPVDIAHALSQICRYGGHAHQFYSVAEHCVHVSHAVPPEDALAALLHDAAEAYVGDMVRPLKQHMPDYRAVEDRLLAVIWTRFGLPLTDDGRVVFPESVKDADNRILIDERAMLLTVPPADWAIEHLQPLNITVACHPPATAKQAWLARLDELLKPAPTAQVTLFKPSGKYYTEEPWRIPSREEVIAAGGNRGVSSGPYCMRYSPDFRRISGGPVLIDAQEPWGYPHLIPGDTQ